MNKTIDERFDDGEEVLSDFNLENAVRPNEEIRRVNVDFPAWMITGSMARPDILVSPVRH